MSKVIDEVVFKKSIEDMLQYLSDNCLYEFVPYDDTEISNLFSLTPEEAQKLSDLISDEVVSKYKLWSSSKVNDEISQSKIECNDYTDKMLTNISSISIKYVDTLPTSDISTSTIYILKNTGGGNDTLNLYDGGSWTVIGDFVISLDDYYKKSEMDTKLNDKANKTEVLLQDKIQTTAGNEPNDTVYSSKLVKTELDKKANDSEVVKKTDISKTIDKTSTDNTVPTSKAVETRMSKREIIKNVDLNTFVDEGKYYIASGCTNSPIDGGYLNIMRYDDDFVCQICARYYISTSKNMYIRTKVSGTWQDWQKLCTTSVDNIPVTSLAWAETTYFENTFTGCWYQVKNGVCFVNIDMICNSPMTGGYKLPITLPTPNTDYVHSSVSSLPNGSYGHSSITIAVTGGGTHVVAYGGIASDRYLGTFSYPVKE